MRAEAGRTGVPVAEVIRKGGMSEQTFYQWKAKYGGLEGSDGQRLRQVKRRIGR